MYQDYYTGKHQFGSGYMPIFRGAKYQCGHGLGNILGGLFRSIILPFIKRNVPMLAGKAIKTGINLASDASPGVLFKQSFKKHVPKALKETVEGVKFQSGSGALKSKHRRRRRRRRRGGQRYNDIFA